MLETFVWRGIAGFRDFDQSANRARIDGTAEGFRGKSSQHFARASKTFRGIGWRVLRKETLEVFGPEPRLGFERAADLHRDDPHVDARVALFFLCQRLQLKGQRLVARLPFFVEIEVIFLAILPSEFLLH